jgi:hypothetical protein
MTAIRRPAGFLLLGYFHYQGSENDEEITIFYFHHIDGAPHQPLRDVSVYLDANPLIQ